MGPYPFLLNTLGFLFLVHGLLPLRRRMMFAPPPPHSSPSSHPPPLPSSSFHAMYSSAPSEPLSMRKHRSLEGAQWTAMASQGGYHPRSAGSMVDQQQQQLLLQPMFPSSDNNQTTSYPSTMMADGYGGSGNPFDAFAVPPPPPPPSQNPWTMPPTNNSSTMANGVEEDDPLAAAWSLYQPVSAQTILQQADMHPQALRRELGALCDRLNYLAASVRTFWAPELRRERHRAREQSRRAAEAERAAAQLQSEAQMLRTELQARRGEEADRVDSGLGSQSRPRDFTDTSYSMQEWQTLKAKLERSELSLADRSRELREAELRAQCAEEQKTELERRVEHLTRTGAANEKQAKLLQEDLEVLRGKLEVKNQQLDGRERERKRTETELEGARAEAREQEHRAQEAERKIGQLTHRIDQLERELREQEMHVERLRQRLMQEPGARAEVQLQQRLENALEDRKKLEQLVDQLRAQTDAERHQQLEQFRAEQNQLEQHIGQLKKELADRHVLISSQNEKIAQLDNAMAKKRQQEQTGEGGERVGQGDSQTKGAASGAGEESELRGEVDRLLQRVHQLERERRQREESGGGGQRDEEGKLDEDGTQQDERAMALKQRIRELEEALRESVGITSEREKSLAEQKQLCQQLSTQVAELFEASASGGAGPVQLQRQLRDALQALAQARSQAEEERLRAQRAMGAVRKELGMALVAEKEAAIGLVQQCWAGAEMPAGIRERIEQLHRQKEQLRHAMLSSTTDPSLMTAMQAPTHPPPLSSSAFPLVGGVQQHQQQFSQPISIQTGEAEQYQQHHHHPPLGLSAPASLLTYGRQDDFIGVGAVDEEGIWA